MLTCIKCAERDRTAWLRAQRRNHDAPPPFGEYFAVTLDDEVNRG